MSLSTHVWLRVARVAAALVAIVGIVLIRPLPQLYGDGLEYAAVMTAWINHASPDIRPQDVSRLPPLFEPYGYSGLHPDTVATTADGKTYGLHFWLYSLACAPAALLLRACGFNPHTAFAATNTLLYVALVAAAFWSTRLTRHDRALIALAAVSPVVRYLPIAHPEAFTWACVLASLIGINHRRYGVAAACAAAGAMQNPPVASLALYCVIIAALERGWRGGLVAGTGATLALAPAAFSWLTFGQLSPLVARGYVDLSWGTVERAFGLLLDLDQGLLTYVPGLLLLATVGVWQVRTLRHLGMWAVFGLFLTGAATNIGANAAFPGIMRYAIWMIPILAWLACASLHRMRRVRLALAAVLLLHAALLVPPPRSTHQHGFLATYALTHWPAWYRPAPGVFAHRVAGLDSTANRLPAPIGFLRDDGTISKVLVDNSNVARLADIFLTDPTYLSTVTAEAANRSYRRYLNPPAGAVRSRCAGGTMSIEEFRRAIQVQVRDAPATSDRRQLALEVEVANRGDHALCNLGGGGRAQFNLAPILREDGREPPESVRTRAAQVLMPGTTQTLTMDIALPARAGRYEIDVLPVLEMVTWGEVGSTLIVDVVSPEPYRATISLKPPTGTTP